MKESYCGLFVLFVVARRDEFKHKNNFNLSLYLNNSWIKMQAL